ncbi:MAG TPA: cytochrome c-type biogenesis protein CcmH [Solirubrobacteraceae bacterium]|nr:cytochrome c-type biogenesis protein CcmH [Solirubrobacteraceae bacterium]
MRVRRRLVSLLAGLCLALALAPGGALAAGRLNAYELQNDFMCVSCHEPLNQVNSPESQAEKSDLVRFVNEGLDLNQIKAQMVSIYGEQVLSQPPAQGISLLVYILPPLVVVAGLGLLGYNLPRWRRRTGMARAAVAGPTGPPQDALEFARLERELAEFDR